MLWPLSVVLVANELQNALMNSGSRRIMLGVLLPKIKKIPKNTNGRLAIPALAGLLVHFPHQCRIEDFRRFISISDTEPDLSCSSVYF